MIGLSRQKNFGQQENEMSHFRGPGNKKPNTFAKQPQALPIRARMDRNNMCKQIGYTNIMQDKRVVIDSNFAKNPYLDKESSAAQKAEARRRTMARKKAQDIQTRALRLHLRVPKFNTINKRQDVEVQTDIPFDEVTTIEIVPNCQILSFQSEFSKENSSSNSETKRIVDTDASTQVDDKDLFDFDAEVTPIAESLITGVFGQAMREILYEDELDARARQQRAWYLRRTIEEIETQRLEQEDKRLNKVIAKHARLFDKGEKTERARIFELTSSRVTDLLPRVLNNLNQNEYSTTNILDSPKFVSWLVDKLQANKTKHYESDAILISTIHDLIKRRLDSHKKN